MEKCKKRLGRKYLFFTGKLLEFAGFPQMPGKEKSRVCFAQPFFPQSTGLVERKIRRAGACACRWYRMGGGTKAPPYQRFIGKN